MTGYEKSAWVEITVLGESVKGLLVDDGKYRVWLPKSQILDSEDDLTVGALTKIELPMWLAEDKGLV